jgi:hypothetical protein
MLAPLTESRTETPQVPERRFCFVERKDVSVSVSVSVSVKDGWKSSSSHRFLMKKIKLQVIKKGNSVRLHFYGALVTMVARSTALTMSVGSDPTRGMSYVCVCVVLRRQRPSDGPIPRPRTLRSICKRYAETWPVNANEWNGILMWSHLKQ